MKYLTAKDVADLHDKVIYAHELQGQAANKSIESIIARIDNRVSYGIITDEFELAACHACYIAVGHAFNDANKRTAMASLDISLAINGIKLNYSKEQAGNMIIKAAQGIVDETELAEWLRNRA